MRDREPLNPTLYRLLERKFGKGNVGIVTPGTSIAWHTEIPALTPRSSTAQQAGERKRPKVVRKVDHSGEEYRVNCFAGETLVVTPAGDRPISSLVGSSRLLVPIKTGIGHWQDVEVRSFGRQPLLTVTLRRRRSVKTIRATAKHRWVLSGRLGLYGQATTSQLKAGDRLASCFVRGLSSYGIQQPYLSPIGVAQGFTFGDGSCELAGRRPATVRIMTRSKDMALLPYYASCRRTKTLTQGRWVWEIQDLPRTWKSLPSSTESLSHLLGWFAGYFAADGHVCRSGTQATIYSANPSHLQFVKGVCYQLGIRVSPIKQRAPRANVGCVPNGDKLPLYSLAFSVRDVPESFWILGHHRARATKWLAKAKSPQRSHWIVESVVDRGETDEVFCAVVPGVEKFTLADNLLTMNCPFCKESRKRLYINHMWGVKDPATGLPNLWLAQCWNETSCLSNYQNQRQLYDSIYFSYGKKPAIRIHPGRDNTANGIQRVEPPGPSLSLEQLLKRSPNSDAIQYLESRHFDPLTLSRCWGVGYCIDSHFALARSRIYIPILYDKMLAGWQTRWPGDLVNGQTFKEAGVPKYWSCPQMCKRMLAYNYHRAIQYPTVVIVEGPMDVWSFGMPAMGIFGTSMYHGLRREFTVTMRKQHGKRASVVVMLDPEQDERSKRMGKKHHIDQLVSELRVGFRDRVLPIYLPLGTDPGSTARRQLRERVSDAAADAKIPISFRKPT